MSMYPHSVSVFCRVGTIGSDEWTRADIEPVRFGHTSASHRSVAGDTGTRSLLVLIPAQALGGYVAPDEFDGAPGTWTLRGGDMVANLCDQPEPPRDALRIESVSVVRISGQIHHLEVR